MAFRFRVLLGALILLVGVGCRKPLTPSVDRNQPPETWITAAPQDTITLRNNGIVVPGTPVVGTIAFRFHIFWAGADRDGSVRGYYFAVVETVKTPGLDIEPPLPGPKPTDYHFTTKTDSTFIFDVLEDTQQRKHAFYVYAVDDQGKADPTPARFIFNALDRFPPIPVITNAYAAGYEFDRYNPSAPSTFHAYAITDTVDLNDHDRAPRDTIPAGSRLAFYWTSNEAISGNPAVGYKYKLDESDFVIAPHGADSVAYAPSNVTVGSKQFYVRAVDVAGAARATPTTRAFVVNRDPDTWFAGPNPSAAGFWSTALGGQRFHNVTWTSPVAVPGSYYGPDSTLVMPKDRVQRKTFLEFYKNVIYLRAENDTVDVNSWVVIMTGGFDQDSPYSVRVDGFAFDTTGAPLLKKGPPNGSPIGFRIYVPVWQYPVGPLGALPLSQLYPLDEALSVPERHVFGYVPMQQSGRAYAVVQAVDGNGRVDARIQNPKQIVDDYEAGNTSLAPLRSRILTFYVNRAPYLQTWQPAFVPKVSPPYSTYTTRLITGLNWATYTQDDDPYEPTNRSPGGPPPNTTTPVKAYYTVTLSGPTATSADTTYVPQPSQAYTRIDVPPTTISVPNFFTGTQVKVNIEVCDFPNTQYIPGQGRCRTYSIPVNIPPPTVATSAASAIVAPPAEPGPGRTLVERGGKP